MMIETPSSYGSWGRLRQARSRLFCPAWEPCNLPAEGPLLAYGMGRSYGDSCLLDGGCRIETRFLDRLVSFDPTSGVLEAEAGISLEAILSYAVPRGWFLPTTPGTCQVTLGGAIANDVHGKNHHQAGCFGNHVVSLDLLRSDGTRPDCRPGDPWFAATVGGLGLTGLITRAKIQMVPIRSAWLEVEQIPFRGLDEFMELSAESGSAWEHTVAWIDCVASGEQLARGIFMRGNWSGEGGLEGPRRTRLAVPLDMPGWALNRHSVRAFNRLYYHRLRNRTWRGRQHFSPFFHPLDAVRDWNRMYGKSGFHQYQCVTPVEAGGEPMKRILAEVAASGQASFLAVLKTFGSVASPGLLSFPRPGITLALDFPERRERTRSLFQRLDALVRECGGCLYPAKDARMEPADFRRGYPALDMFRNYVDPAFSSDFWRRMEAEPSLQSPVSPHSP